MQVPFHPSIVHFPIALTFIMPIFLVIFALFIKNNKMSPKAWLILVGLQVVIVGSGYIALESGEDEEHQVAKVVSKKLIHEHEEAAEVFVGASVLVLVLSIGAFFLRNEFSFPFKLGVAALSLIACFLAYRTGKLGGELVYLHGAPNAYLESPQGILPTPGMNTSESPYPVNENESLKVDDNDYGNGDESDPVMEEMTEKE